jgi:hypothetical protein
MMGRVALEESVLKDLDVALNEATVAGLRPGPDGSIQLLLQVLALPETGPVDPDTRRALVLSGVSKVRVLLRRDRNRDSSYGPVVPLPRFAAVEELFASLSWSGHMYGWKFFDSIDLIDDWPPAVSLDITLNPAPAAHSLYWFNECGRQEPDGRATYCIEGVVDFEDLAAQHPNGTPITVENFTATGRRWWQSFYGDDPRVSPQAQAALGTPPSWRPKISPQHTSAVMIADAVTLNELGTAIEARRCSAPPDSDQEPVRALDAGGAHPAVPLESSAEALAWWFACRRGAGPVRNRSNRSSRAGSPCRWWRRCG